MSAYGLDSELVAFKKNLYKVIDFMHVTDLYATCISLLTLQDLNHRNNQPVHELHDKKWFSDIGVAFLINFTANLSDLNINLQQREQLFQNTYNHIKSFQNKLKWQIQMMHHISQ